MKAHLTKSLLSKGIALALCVPAGSAFAQTPPSSEAENMDTITVSGVRASLGRAVETKRNAGTVIDSISAIELGKFPDDNVADSLSHITGVAISRTAGGEGQKVSIRGLGPEYTLTTFNDRILATDGAGRDFAFDVLPSDVINGADVVKGAQASLTEGAIGGLVNLRSASPFDQGGQQIVARLEGDRNLMSELNGTKFSGVYSNTFANDTFGVLVGVVFAERKDRTDIAGNDGGWTRNADPTDVSWQWGNAWGGSIDPNGNGELDEDEYGLIGPGQFRVGSVLETKKRRAFTTKLEWRPNDDVKITLDGLKTRLDSPQVGFQQSYYPLYAPERWTDMTIENGIVTGFTMDNPDAEMAMNPELLNVTEHRVVDTDLYGLNGEWAVSDKLTMTGDVYRSTSKRYSGGQDTYVVLRMNQPNTARIELSGTAVPNVTINFDDGREFINGLAQGEFGPSDFNTHYMELRGDDIVDEINGATVGGKFDFSDSGFKALKFGVQYTDRKKTRDLVNNTLSGGANYYSGGDAINVEDLGNNVISHSFTLPHFMNEVGANFPRTFLAFDVPNYLAALEAYDGTARPSGGTYDYSNAAPEWNQMESYRVTEKTTGIYLQADLGGERWSADVGVRFVKTKTTAQAWDSEILDIEELGPFNFVATYADPAPIFQDGDYNFVLPSANFKWSFTDDLLLRAGVAKTMARPPVDKLAPSNTTASITWGEFTQVYSGNVDLQPYSAKQADLSLEWYFAENSIVNVAAFYKRIDSQITTSWEPNVDIGVEGYTFNIVRPINGDHAKVHGYEVGAQHFFGNGFGLRGQYTHNTSSSFVPDAEGVIIERPLEGIAPSVYSLSAMYEKGPISLGITADHTDGFVTATNVLGEGFNEQADSITWMTAHASYNINEMFTVTLQGQNLLDEEQTYSINGNPLLQQGYYRYGRSFNLGVSVRF
jgi:iron complex outermembrane receptor protein